MSLRGTKALEKWCQKVTSTYPQVNITNMTSSWRNGLGFCAIIHHHHPNLLDIDSLDPEDVFGNNYLAFKVAEEDLGIPSLLDPKDMVECQSIDRLSVLTYVAQYYKAMHNKTTLMSNKLGVEGVKDKVEATEDIKVKSSEYNVAKLDTNVINCQFKMKINANKELDLKTCQFKYKVKPIVDQEDSTKTCQSAKRDTKMTSWVTEEVEEETVQEKVEVKHVAKIISGQDNGESKGNINRPNRVEAKKDFNVKSTLCTKVNTSQQRLEAKRDTNIKFGEYVEEDLQIETCEMQNSQQSVEAIKGTNIRTSSRPKVEAERSLRVEIMSENIKSEVTKDVKASSSHYSKIKPIQHSKLKTEATAANEVIEDIKVSEYITNAVLEPDKPSSVITKEEEKKEVTTCIEEEEEEMVTLHSQEDDDDPRHLCEVCNTPVYLLERRSTVMSSNSTVHMECSSTVHKETTMCTECEGGRGGQFYCSLCGGEQEQIDSKLNLYNETKTRALSSLKKTSSGTPPVVMHLPTKTIEIPFPFKSETPRKASPGMNNNKEVCDLPCTPCLESPRVCHKELFDLEIRLNGLEKQGVELEKKIRNGDQSVRTSELSEEDLILQLFDLVNEKNAILRKQSEIVLEVEESILQAKKEECETKMRLLMDIPELNKTESDRIEEENLIAQIIRIVDKRNKIVNHLEMERLRESEEDQELLGIRTNLSQHQEPRFVDGL